MAPFAADACDSHQPRAGTPSSPPSLTAESALPGRADPVLTSMPTHRVFGERLDHEFGGAEVANLGMGCFWGAEKLFWNTEGVLSTAVGYQGGFTPNPTYAEVCSGRTGHAEVVRVIFDPAIIGYEGILRLFFEQHDPTQGDRQGNDVGSQYRSVIFTNDTLAEESQAEVAVRVRGQFQQALTNAGFGLITTEIAAAGPFYAAEEEHQQYLDAHRDGYCPVHATGVSCALPPAR